MEWRPTREGEEQLIKNVMGVVRGCVGTDRHHRRLLTASAGWRNGRAECRRGGGVASRWLVRCAGWLHAESRLVWRPWAARRSLGSGSQLLQHTLCTQKFHPWQAVLGAIITSATNRSETGLAQQLSLFLLQCRGKERVAHPSRSKEIDGRSTLGNLGLNSCLGALVQIDVVQLRCQPPRALKLEVCF